MTTATRRQIVPRCAVQTELRDYLDVLRAHPRWLSKDRPAQRAMMIHMLMRITRREAGE